MDPPEDLRGRPGESSSWESSLGSGRRWRGNFHRAARKEAGSRKSWQTVDGILNNALAPVRAVWSILLKWQQLNVSRQNRVTLKSRQLLRQSYTRPSWSSRTTHPVILEVPRQPPQADYRGGELTCSGTSSKDCRWQSNEVTLHRF